MLEAIATAFDEHDLDGIMAHFADDAVFEGPRGSEAFGTRFTGADAIRDARAARSSAEARTRADEGRASLTRRRAASGGGQRKAAR